MTIVFKWLYIYLEYENQKGEPFAKAVQRYVDLAVIFFLHFFFLTKRRLPEFSILTVCEMSIEVQT